MNGQFRYLNNIVIGDKAWLYYYDVLTKFHNKIWVFEVEDTPLAVKKLQSIKKKMIAALLFKLSIIVQSVLLDTQKTSKCYIEQCLPTCIESFMNL